MEKTTFQERSVIASWTYTLDTKINAKKKGGDIVFEIEGNRSSISEIALLNIQGWIPPDDVERDADLSTFYKQFRPVLMDGFTAILSLVDREIAITQTKMGRMVVFIEK